MGRKQTDTFNIIKEFEIARNKYDPAYSVDAARSNSMSNRYSVYITKYN